MISREECGMSSLTFLAFCKGVTGYNIVGGLKVITFKRSTKAHICSISDDEYFVVQRLIEWTSESLDTPSGHMVAHRDTESGEMWRYFLGFGHLIQYLLNHLRLAQAFISRRVCTDNSITSSDR